MIKIKEQQGRNSVTVILLFAFLALFLRIAIKEIIKANITQNESNASVTLKSISAALENYAKDNHGIFPVNLAVLTQTDPPYLNKSYLIKTSIKGYNFSCQRLEPTGYSCVATPNRCDLSGKLSYNITTGGILVSDGCSGKE